MTATLTGVRALCVLAMYAAAMLVLVMQPDASTAQGTTAATNVQKYIVSLKPGFREDHLHAEFSKHILASASASASGSRRSLRSASGQQPAEVHRVHHVMELDGHLNSPSERRALAVVDVHVDYLPVMESMPGVESIEADSPIWLAAVDQDTRITGGEPIWGLDRINQAHGIDSRYTTRYTGANVDIYVVDTGVRGTHKDFGNRVMPGRDVITAPGIFNANSDCNGHGTHVASTAAGAQYGVAKEAIIVPVKVVDCTGRGSVSGLIAGLDYVRSTARTRPSRKAVINMSLSAGNSPSLNSASRACYNEGIVVVAAAGNSATDACNYSPSSESTAITVGGTFKDDSRLEVSNVGRCVDVYAPGDRITAAGHASDDAVALKRGTSMASPHVAGLAALYWDKFPSFNNQRIFSTIVSNTVRPNIVSDIDCSGSLNPNKIVQTPDAGHGAAPWQYVADGNYLRSDFKDWPEFLQGKEAGTDVCFTFEARVGSGPLNTGLQVAFASDPVNAGLQEYLGSPTSCKNSQLYFVSVAISSSSANTWLKGSLVQSSTRSGDPLGRSSRGFFARAFRDNAGATVYQVGQGANVDEGNLLAEYRDTSTASVSRFVHHMAFASQSGSDVVFSNIRPCDGSSGPSPTPPPVESGDGGQPTSAPRTPKPTPTPAKAPVPSPTPPPRPSQSGAGYLADGSSLNGEFVAWWTTSESQGTGNLCFEFNAKGPRDFLIALAEDSNVMGYQDGDAQAYVIHVARKLKQGRSVSFLRRRGTLVTQSPPSEFPIKSKVFRNFRAQTSDAGLVLLDYRVNARAPWRAIISFYDQEPLAVRVRPRYISFSTLAGLEMNIADLVPCGGGGDAVPASALEYQAPEGYVPGSSPFRVPGSLEQQQQQQSSLGGNDDGSGEVWIDTSAAVNIDREESIGAEYEQRRRR